jgi:SpoVK/Ycf46/Vps4 family AAA+-type ATPase
VTNEPSPQREEAKPLNNRDAVVQGIGLVANLLQIRELRLASAPATEVAAAWESHQSQRRSWMAAMHEGQSRGESMKLLTLERQFGLLEADLDALLIALAPLADPEFLERFGRARKGFYFRGVDVELVLGLLFPTMDGRVRGRDLFAPDAPLLRYGLVSLAPVGGDLNPFEVEVRVADAIVNFILERPLLDGMLSQYCAFEPSTHRWEEVILPSDDKERIWNIVSGESELRGKLDAWGYGTTLGRGRGLVLLFAGPPGTGKTAFAHAIANRLNRPLLVVRVSRLLSTREPLFPILTQIFWAAGLAGAVVLMDDCEALLAERDARFLALLETIEKHDGIFVLSTNLAPRIDFAMERRIVYRMDFEPPGTMLREQLWEVHLPPDVPLGSDIDLPVLAATYEFTGALIRNTVLVAVAKLLATGGDAIDMAQLREAAESQLRGRFDHLAVKGASSVSLQSLVLPEDERTQLAEVLSACRNHDEVLTRWGFGKRLPTGRGICVLFDGPPGTGKTLAAEIIAGELRRPIYRVHIPGVVSKWVGETERNIAEIFVRARSSRAILLFDEADSLFGSRTSGSSANDRYANMEVNLLLQEIERYDGVTILTTNLYGNLDEALQRRIQFRITFPFPDPGQRAKIWEVLLPPEAPRAADVDFAYLGKQYELAGGHIKNALLRAAYRAKDDGGVITHRHLVTAAIAECRSQGKLVADFGAMRSPRPVIDESLNPKPKS